VWLVHGEKPGGWALCGGGLILLATLLNTWKQTAAVSSKVRGRSADM
jgi:drug/metabolite transporter (DMT)-like permease